MKISYNWLKQFINTDLPSDKAGELLTDLGLEVEGIESFETVKGGLKGIVVGHVLECEQHPNADRLKLTKVDLGNGEPVQIVCGAPNVDKGQKVPVATVGTTLYDASGEPWQIKKGKIRGEVSMGMICAEDELGLGESHDGIMVLDQALEPGTPCADIFEIENDQVFEIGLTPNRADAMSHYGVARDLRAGLLQQGTHMELITPSVSSFHVDNRTLRIDVDVKDKELCPRYCGVTISGVKVTESPDWLKNRLLAIGIAPKNNVVDITNYVLHELGQPLHAFDAVKIEGNKIEVKTLKAGTKFVTLDEVERELSEDDLMICDQSKPLCIAGVFGGLHSGVTENTTQVFLESAYFDPVSVRKTAKRHGLNTDASFRFERGIDINTTKYALMRAALMIKDIAGGHISSDVEDIYPVKFEDFQVFLTFEKIYSLIGQEIPTETIKSILTSLEIKINNVTETGIGLTIPSYRVDVQREVDVIEEILRVYGYNNIHSTQKFNASVAPTSRFEDHKVSDVIGNLLASQGYYEILANSLTTPKYTELTDTLNKEQQVKIINPLSNELSVLRQSMLFSGLEALSYNINRKNDNLQLFEFGKTYFRFNDKREEFKHLTLLVTGDRHPETWNTKSGPTDFFYLKGTVEGLLERLGINNLKVKPVNSDIYSEGLTYFAGKIPVVSFGLVARKITKAMDIKQPVFYADFNWDNVLMLINKKGVQFREIPKFPEVRRDLALLLDEATTFGELHQTAMQAEKKLLKAVNLFDVYQGNTLPEGKKSYALSFTLADDQKTLTDKQIDKVMKKLQNSFEKQFGATLR
ncbi:phenylalanine--tRNA ligase subunit beta [Robertkochia marina]|uniref:Phenylalanine--tRNA ligase beta subunit n=1 Tax=Robertkochia marina TaxID=1227945 RepID=A0A4S3M1B0_9FLAO|nr:phenylalanine--tRNA ligase subunit beta [Robertkochia marina]THD67968.1 phenylalanine--tRNA ligase subunit beta [Robertkochia marina]TRZ41534.1 phenylalanine--tRNA ligase subunit beta [Robertkochia marina]